MTHRGPEIEAHVLCADCVDANTIFLSARPEVPRLVPSAT
jgi:hypothetical protein